MTPQDAEGRDERHIRVSVYHTAKCKPCRNALLRVARELERHATADPEGEKLRATVRIRHGDGSLMDEHEFTVTYSKDEDGRVAECALLAGVERYARGLREYLESGDI